MTDFGKVEVDRREMEMNRKNLDEMSLEEYLLWCSSSPTLDDDLADMPDGRREDIERNREEYPNGCELCGEPAGAEMGEFYDPSRDDGRGGFLGHVLAHAQCGLDRGLEMA